MNVMHSLQDLPHNRLDLIQAEGLNPRPNEVMEVASHTFKDKENSVLLKEKVLQFHNSKALFQCLVNLNLPK
jgi:hypothetical protein